MCSRVTDLGLDNPMCWLRWSHSRLWSRMWSVHRHSRGFKGLPCVLQSRGCPWDVETEVKEQQGHRGRGCCARGGDGELLEGGSAQQTME